MTTHQVSISETDIINDGMPNVPIKTTQVNPGDKVEYDLGPLAKQAGYSFQESNAANAVDTIISQTGGISDQQARDAIASTTPSISGDGDSILTLTISDPAPSCQAKFNIKIKTPGGPYKEFDPIISIIPK